MNGSAETAALRRTIRFWAGLDLLVTAVLAWPGTAFWLIQLLFQLSGWLGGRSISGPVDSLYLFFVYLSGALGVLWALGRLLQPLPQLALIDAIARLWVTGLIVYMVTVYKAPIALLAFCVTEVAGAAHQGYRLWRTRRPSAG